MFLKIFILLIFFLLNYYSVVYKPFKSSGIISVLVFIFSRENQELVEVDYISVWDQISHCNTLESDKDFTRNSKKFPFRLGTGYVRYDRRRFVLNRCMDEDRIWEHQESFNNCHIFDNIVDFVPILDISDEEIVLISCETPNREYVQEIFVSEYPKFQALKFYSNAQRLLNRNLPDLYYPNGESIFCVSNFPFQTDVYWIRKSATHHHDYSRGQMLLIDLYGSNVYFLQNEKNIYDCKLKYNSSNVTYEISATYEFFVEILYNVTLYDSFRNPNRTKYDAGETIFCGTGSFLPLKNAIWHKPEVLAEITLNGVSQPLDEYVTIKPSLNMRPPIYGSISCLIQGHADNPYYIFYETFSVLTNAVTEIKSNKSANPLTEYQNMTCKTKGYNISLFSNIYKELPLSTFMVKCHRINNSADFKVSVPVDFRWDQLYFVVCTKPNSDMLTPLEIEPSKIKVLFIRPIYPDYIEQTEYQMKGFIYECYTNDPDYRVEWHCPSCARWDLQKLTYTNSDENAQNLEIISTVNVHLIYQCHALYDNDTVTVKLLYLNIVEGLVPTLTKPEYFYSPNDPVICRGKKIIFNLSEEISIPLPTKIMYTNNYNDIYEISTAPETYPYNLIAWSPRIPNIPKNKYEKIEWKFKGCCLQYINDSLHCRTLHDLDVIWEYHFVYNFLITQNEFYPGDIIRCCITSPYFKTNIIQNAVQENCIPARMQFQAKKSVIRHPFMLIEGYQIRIPDLFRYYDIDPTVAHVGCYVDDFGKKELDLNRTRRRIFIKSCSKFPPGIEMQPKEDTVFYPNETIRCITRENKCHLYLKFNFTLEHDSKLLMFVIDANEIVLTDKFIGNNFLITCKTGVRNVTKITRIISINSLPSNIKFKGWKRIMMPKDEISCHYNASKPSTMVWKQISGPEPLLVINSRILIRTRNGNGNYSFTCLVANNHGSDERSIYFTVYNPNLYTSIVRYKFYFFIYLSLIFYHVFVLFIAYFIFKDYLYMADYSAHLAMNRKSCFGKSKKE